MDEVKRRVVNRDKSKTPTIRDVAQQAGVAPITVSRVINKAGYVSPETRARVEAAIESLRYVPNSLSRSLRFKKTNMIAMLVSDITNPFWTTVTRGAEDASSEHGLSVILCNTDEKQDKLDGYVNVLLQKQIDGFLFVPIGDDVETIHTIEHQGTPVVVIDRTQNTQVDIVRSDSEGGAYQLTRHLLELGHRRIAIVPPPTTVSTGRDRLAGYKRALNEAGLPIDSRLIHEGGYSHDAGYRTARYLLVQGEPRPTAFFAGNNLIATGILRALHEQGLRVPQDVSIVSFDDLPYNVLSDPFLTVAVQDPYTMGFEAAKLLIRRINGDHSAPPREVVLPVEIIIRSSCAPI